MSPQVKRFLIGMIAVALIAGAALFLRSARAAGVDYSVGSTLYCAQSVAQTPQVMTFTGWALGRCGDTPPPAGLYASGRLSYGGRGGFISNANLLDWSVLWGRSGVEGQPVPFPGSSGATPVWTPGRGQYTCSKFRTGAVGSVTGQIKNSSYYSQSVVDISLSTSCGDFAPAQPACLKTNVAKDDRPVLFFDIGGAGTFKCHLSPNTDYYENIRRTSPTANGAISVIGQQG